jgi:hypothetical protein
LNAQSASIAVLGSATKIYSTNSGVILLEAEGPDSVILASNLTLGTDGTTLYDSLITIRTDDLTIDASTVVTGGIGAVTITPEASDRPINIGTAPLAGYLNLAPGLFNGVAR